ncbi:MAG: metal ABC transporter ATP-binding protein [Verrucomicrobia bacterium]|nr:metal ABC transporter ATP-binding protein [Verrucomicrobiota bacterium]MCH8511251.1 metal ABC transporter ATP-binding protein [Kiritimatiellia bacterium]
MSMPLLTLEHVTLGYPGKALLKNLDFAVSRGEFFGIVGPNGAGKSTLLKTLLGLLPPLAGHLHWPEGRPVIGYVPQRERVDPIWPMRVRDVLHHTLCALGRPHFRRKREHASVAEVMAATGIEALANQTLDTLSGGEMQRLLLARALVVDPAVLVLDEPTAAMDLVATETFMNMISRLHRERGISILLVTHDLQSLSGRADRLGILQSGQLHQGSPEDLLTSESLGRIYGQKIQVDTLRGRSFIHIAHETVSGFERIGAGGT